MIPIIIASIIVCLLSIFWFASEPPIVNDSALKDYIQNSDFVKIAILEATHRYYFDVASKKPDSSNIANIHGNLWCIYPDWRQRIKRHIERYDKSGMQLINDLPICNKPKKVIFPIFKLTIHFRK